MAIGYIENAKKKLDMQRQRKRKVYSKVCYTKSYI